MLGNISNLVKSRWDARKLAATFKVDNKSALAQLKQHFKDLSLAASFDPFHPVFADNKISAMDALHFLVEKLKIANIRLALRWSVIDQAEQLDLGYYAPFLDYCFANNVTVILNVGPIKHMRWPEEHIPDKYRQLVTKRDTITPTHPLAKPALNYLNQILKLIKHKYKQQLSLIKAIQADNENYNRFGQFELLISQEFESEVFKIISQNFKNKPIFINSSGLNDFPEILSLTGQFLSKKFCLGVNYYYKVPGQSSVPLINLLDNLIIGRLKGTSAHKLKSEMDQRHYELEVSELQAEPWRPQVTSPGNDLEEFIFSLLRTQYLRPSQQKRIVARIWGIEELVYKFLASTELNVHEQIRDLILALNE